MPDEKMPELSALLANEQSRQSALRSAITSLEDELITIEKRIELLQSLIGLDDDASKVQESLSAALRLVGGEAAENRAASGDSAGGISRTLGKRIYAFVSEHLNQPGCQMDSIERLYKALPSDIRAEIESTESSNTPLFRFRRLLRRNKEDFAVDRNTGVVRYRRYAPPPDFGADFPPPPKQTSATAFITIVGRRFDKGNWLLRYITPSGTIAETSVGQFIKYLDAHDNEGVFLRRPDGSHVGVATFKLQGKSTLESFHGGEWTTDLDYGLPILTDKLPVKEPKTAASA